MRAQIERWENEGGRVPFIEKQSSRFKTGVTAKEKEMTTMSTKITNDGIGIPDQDLREGARVLTQLLADEHVLFHKLRNYHWNVRGLHFSELHGLFEGQYELIGKRIDEAAERIRQLGYPAPATMTEFLQLTGLSEHPGDYSNASVMIGNILEDHELLARYIRREIEAESGSQLDIGTIDFLTGLLRDHEKMAWMLRATLSVVGEPWLKANGKDPKSVVEDPLYYSG